METFENTITIRRPAEEVFAFLADFENVPRWNYAIEKTRKISPGPAGVGTVYRQTRSIPAQSEEAFEVIVFEPGKRLAVRGQIGPFRARIGYLLETAPGGTKLTNDVALDPSPGVLRLAARMAAPRVKAAVAENLSKLKEILEARNQQGGPLARKRHPRQHTFL